MFRMDATERPPAARHRIGNDYFLTYDIFHVWPDGKPRNGVRWSSDVHAYIKPVTQESFNDGSDPTKKLYRIQVWVPGREVGVEVKLPWGQEWWAPPQDWGIVSVVSLDNVPLNVFWELSAGKE